MPSAICTASIASSKRAPIRARARHRPPRAHDAPPEQRDGEREHPRDQPVIELHGRHVPEEVPPPRLEHQDLGRHEVRRSSSGNVLYAKPGADAGDEAAGQHHHEHERGDAAARIAAERGAGRDVVRRASRARAATAPSTASPPKISEREPEMRGQPELRHARIVDEAALHHVPAERALQRRPARRSRRAASRSPRGMRRRATKPEEAARRNTTPISAAEQPVRILPPEDALELGERHRVLTCAELGRRAGTSRTRPASRRRRAAASCRRSAATRRSTARNA